MLESPRRAASSAWRVLGFVGTAALLLAAVVAATGGGGWTAGPLRLRAHEPWRILVAGLCLAGASLWLGGAQARAALARIWEARNRYAGPIAAAAAAAAAATGLVWGTGVAGGADPYGYVSQAMLWLKGLPLQAEPLTALVPWSNAEWTFSPLGFRPGLDPGTIVPTYPPGLPLVMSAFAAVLGPGAVYWVVPASGAAAVWLTYLIGRRHADAASGATAALLLAVSPVFLYQVVQPMSDVPVTAWWLLSLWGAATGRPLGAGTGAAAAVVTRPNLAPLALLVVVAVLAHAYSRHHRGALRRAAVAVLLPLAGAAVFLAWLNARLYGSPVASGYGSLSELFTLANVPVNVWRYTRWLLETQTPIVLLGLAVPVVARVPRWRASEAPPAHAWFGLAFAAGVVACYLPYAPFEEWWYLRFLLPAIPVLLVMSAPVLMRLASTAPASARAPLLVAAVILLATYCVSTASERSAFDLRRLESRYLAAGAYASRELPASAVLLSVQESGPLRMYGGRTTLRFDHLDPQGLDAAVEFLDQAGRQPYFVLEAWEEGQFRDRFARSSVLGRLDWPPKAEVGAPVKVRFYDPHDRSPFLAGEPVSTARDADSDRRRR